MQKKVLIFDFDGTLADTLPRIVDITNSLASEFGYPPSSNEDVSQIRQLGAWQVIQRSGVSIFKLPSLIRRIQKELSKEIEHTKLFSDMAETLSKLKDNGHTLGIVSSNSSENVNKFLEINHLEHLFDFVVSSTTLFGKHRSLKKIIWQQHLNLDHVIYIGDETRDIEAAKKIGIKIIAVGWGFNSVEILTTYKPTYLLHSPLEILGVIDDE